MKTLSKLVLCAALASAAVSYAGPPPLFWQNRPVAKPRALKAKTAPTSPQARPSALTCSYMVVPNTGQGFSKSAAATIRCTPEMLKNDWRYQQACAANASKH